MNKNQEITDYQFLTDVMKELPKARKKYPQPNPTLAALNEEAGEVTKAVLHLREGKETSWQVLYDEAVQVAVMAIRIATEGDEVMGVVPTMESFDRVTTERQYPSWLGKENWHLWNAIPEYMHDGIDRYVSRGVKPGSFLLAVFENDLLKSVGHADMENSAIIKEWALFVNLAMPGRSVGSKEKVKVWIERGGLKGD